MKMYCCQPQVQKLVSQTWAGAKKPFERVSSQVPTFYLHPDIQGIISVEHAETIVVDICNPTHDKNIVVVPNVTVVFIE